MIKEITEKLKSSTAIEINGVTFHSFQEMLIYMDKLREENIKMKAKIEKMKNYQNCDYQLHIVDCPIFKSGGHISCKNCPHWILQEVKND